MVLNGFQVYFVKLFMVLVILALLQILNHIEIICCYGDPLQQFFCFILLPVGASSLCSKLQHSGFSKGLLCPSHFITWQINPLITWAILCMHSANILSSSPQLWTSMLSKCYLNGVYMYLKVNACCLKKIKFNDSVIYFIILSPGFQLNTTLI